MRRYTLALFSLLLGSVFLTGAPAPSTDNRLKGSFRRPEQNGWIYVHLEGKPYELGFQHGYWLAPETQTTFRAAALLSEHDSKRPWSFFRTTVEKVLWPHIEKEYCGSGRRNSDHLRAKRRLASCPPPLAEKV